MYKINVVLRYPFFSMTGGRRVVVVEMKPGCTLKDLIAKLSTEYTQISNYISKYAVNPAEHMLAVREGAILKFSDPLSDGDTIQLLPPISGG